MSVTPAIYHQRTGKVMNGDPEAVDMYMERNGRVIEYEPRRHNDPCPWKVHDGDLVDYGEYPTREAAILAAWDHTYRQLRDMCLVQSELRRAWQTWKDMVE